MSKLGKALKSHRMDERKHLMRSVTPILASHIAAPSTMDYATRYEIGATFVKSVYLTHEDINTGRVNEAIQKAKAEILLEVFGEFIVMAREIDHALYNYDIRHAQELLNKMLRGFLDDEEVSV